MEQMNYSAVIFDLDGTLLDTLDDLADACNRVLAAAGLPNHPIDQYRYFVGDGLQTLIQRILPEDLRDEKHVREFANTFRQDYIMNWKVKTRLYEGIETMLNSLQNMNISMNVLSNKPHEFTELCVRNFLGSWSFDVVLGQKDGVARKPDPAGALDIAGKIRVAPADTLYVGDTATDMQTALAAGMFPVGALWGFRTEDELRQNGAGLLIGQPQELIQWLS